MHNLSRIGSVIYHSVVTRPDIAFACSVLSSFSSNPSQEHFDEEYRYKLPVSEVVQAMGNRNKILTLHAQICGAFASLINLVL